MNGWLLGSGGGISTHQRSTCSTLLIQGTHGLLVDAGTGVSRLLESPDLLDGVERLDVVLTHFHLDHVAGLPYLPALGLSTPPTIYGPGERLYQKSTDSVLRQLFAHPLLASSLDSITDDVRDLDYGITPFGEYAIAGREQPLHSDPTLALRINDEIAYCTDTSYDPDNASFARGCRILFHEAWYVSGATYDTDNHSSGADAATVARDADVAELVLIHVKPLVNESALLNDATSIFGNTRVGADLMSLDS